MIKKILFMMRRNAMTLLGAALLASGIFYVVNNPNIFMASILSLQEKQFIESMWRDVAYKTSDGYVDIFLAENKDIPTSIEFSIIFDEDTITLDTNNITGQWTRNITNTVTDAIYILSLPWITINTDESLLMIPFSGDARDILLSEAIATIQNTTQRLSIGSLNEFSGHSE